MLVIISSMFISSILFRVLTSIMALIFGRIDINQKNKEIHTEIPCATLTHLHCTATQRLSFVHHYTCHILMKGLMRYKNFFFFFLFLMRHLLKAYSTDTCLYLLTVGKGQKSIQSKKRRSLKRKKNILHILLCLFLCF